MKKLIGIIGILLLMVSCQNSLPNKPAPNEIWYTATDKLQVDTDSFGVDIIKHVWRPSQGIGILVSKDEIIKIGDGAFGGCTSLTSVTIPDSVTEIGEEAFKDCAGELIINSNCLGLFGGKFTKLTIGNSVTSIGDDAFSNCTSLTSVTIPDSVTSIGHGAFRGCTSLTSVTIGNSVTSIGFQAFFDCTLLTSVDITDLSAWCKISFGDSYANPLRNGAKLYLNGSELTDITIPSDITEIKNYAFSGYTSLASVTIPDSVTSIGSYAFFYCTSLASITIPDSVTSIGDWAFYNCSSLTSITIPDSVTSIGDSAFLLCTSLTSVAIPDSVTSIRWAAFSGCTSLTEVYCKPTTPPAGDSYMFDENASGRKIYVPRNSVEAYKSAEYWSSYASYIEGYDF